MKPNAGSLLGPLGMLALACAGCATQPPAPLKWLPSLDDLPLAWDDAPAVLVDHATLVSAVVLRPGYPDPGIAVGKPSSDYFSAAYARHFGAVAPVKDATASTPAFANAPTLRATFEGASFLADGPPDDSPQQLLAVHYGFTLTDRSGREISAWRVSGKSAIPPLSGPAWSERTRELAPGVAKEPCGNALIRCLDPTHTLQQLSTLAIEDAGRRLVEHLSQDAAIADWARRLRHDDMAPGAVRIEARSRSVGTRPSTLPSIGANPLAESVRVVELTVQNGHERLLDIDPSSITWHRPSVASLGTLPSQFVERVALPAAGKGPHASAAMTFLGGASHGMSAGRAGIGLAGAGAAIGALVVLAIAAAAAGIAVAAEHVDHHANADAIEAYRSELLASALTPSAIEAGTTLAGKIYLHRPSAETSNEIVVMLVDRERLRRYTFVVPVTEAAPASGAGTSASQASPR